MAAKKEERMKILRMVQEGKISAQDAARLLHALEQSDTPPTGRRARWLRIRVTDVHSDELRVNVTLPISLVLGGMKVGERFAPQIEGLSTEQLRVYLEEGFKGHIVDVFDDVDGERVEILLE